MDNNRTRIGEGAYEEDPLSPDSCNNSASWPNSYVVGGPELGCTSPDSGGRMWSSVWILSFVVLNNFWNNFLNKVVDLFSI
jgi:hypothetical protein